MDSLLHRVSYLKWPAMLVCLFFVFRTAVGVLSTPSELPKQSLGAGLLFWGFALAFGKLANPAGERHILMGRRASAFWNYFWACVYMGAIAAAFLLIALGEAKLTDLMSIGLISAGVQGLGLVRDEMTRLGW